MNVPAQSQVSVFVKNQAQQEAELFEGPILEYSRMTTALKTALNKRNEKKMSYLAAAHDLEAKKAHHSKVAGMGGDRQVCMPWSQSPLSRLLSVLEGSVVRLHNRRGGSRARAGGLRYRLPAFEGKKHVSRLPAAYAFGDMWVLQERVQAAEDAVNAATENLEKAREQYEDVSERVVREFARFRRDKASDMKKMILNYVNVQVRTSPWPNHVRAILTHLGWKIA